MPVFNGIIKSDNNSLVRKPTTSFAGIVGFPLTYAVLPYSQPNNLVGWFNNADGITTATGVSAWTDRISGAILAQSTAALQPTYTQQVQSLNGKNKIAFTPTQYISAGDSFDVRTNTGYTVQCYAKITAVGGTNRQLIGKGPLAAAPTIVGEYQIGHNGSNYCCRFFDNVSLKTTGTFAVDTNNYYLYSMVIDITNSLLSFYVNEKAVGTGTISNTAVDYNNGSAFFVGSNASIATSEVLEVLVYQTALTQIEIAQNTKSFKSKFGQI